MKKSDDDFSDLRREIKVRVNKAIKCSNEDERDALLAEVAELIEQLDVGVSI